MGINYLYIDDETDEKVEGIKRNLSIHQDKLSVDFKRPVEWNKQIDIIKSELKNYDGILLDLKLEFSINDEEALKYYGSDLAQAIRTMVKTGVVNDVPILLCSTDKKLKTSFDGTGTDLFDKTYCKESDFEESNVIDEFVNFSEAYKIIQKSSNIKDILGDIENNFLFEISSVYDDIQTVHEKSSFILGQVIMSSGALLEESLLAIRLGVNIDLSEDWNELKDIVLKDIRYTGIYSKVYPRWWAQSLLMWFRDTFNTSLQVIDSTNRVELISEKYSLSKLVPLETPKFHNYSTFWYKCHLSNAPLEIADGIKTSIMPKYIWHEPLYISLNYIMSEERNTKTIKSLLGTYEIERVNKIIQEQR